MLDFLRTKGSLQIIKKPVKSEKNMEGQNEKNAKKDTKLPK